MQMSYFT
ncbi:hypothetical protein Zm00014a_039602 [Zea mays]|nr:hypothetical protein Zm00014a_039602 [Zea mays]